MKRLPSLDSLRAFEAAARHLSFTRAGDELHVTQSALSHRIKALEDELGVALFRRVTRALEMTREGEILAQGVRRGLTEIARAVASLDHTQVSGPLRVTVLPSLAARWLIPRLKRFRRLYPDVDVRIVGDAKLVDLRARSADLAIRFGRGQYPGLNVVRLMSDAVFPVCSPRLLAEIGPIESPQEITRFPLLHDAPTETDASGSDWASWLAHVGAADVPAREGLRFDDANLTLEAASNGLGLALARRSLVTVDLSSSRLVRVLPQEAPTSFAYFLVMTPEMAENPSATVFCQWLLAEAGGGSPAPESNDFVAPLPPPAPTGRKRR
jgi:LysR family glycine cleavage system transcriptional activator